MAISSLIIDVTDDQAGIDALAAIAADARCTLGPHHAGRHALVVETADVLESTALYERLGATAGIASVQLVAAWLDDAPVPAGVGATVL
jgi:hypothetical protein